MNNFSLYDLNYYMYKALEKRYKESRKSMGRKPVTPATPTYRPGMTIAFTIKNAKIIDVHYAGLVTKNLVVKDETGRTWGISPDNPSTEVKINTPAHKKISPGQVWSANGMSWFVRKSNPDLLMIMPEDLSTGLKTITEDEFFITYPDAQLIYAGNRQAIKSNGHLEYGAQKSELRPATK